MKSSYPCQGLYARTTLRAFTKPAAFAYLLALSSAPFPSHAASPPTATLIYNASGPVQGGVALGPDGNVYFASISSGGNNARITSLTSSGTFRWEYIVQTGGIGGDIYPVPAIDAAGTKLYIGTDEGIFYCIDTAANPANRVIWRFPLATANPPTLPDKIRSGAALDPTLPEGSTVYFQCNDGNLYALNADNGTQRTYAWMKSGSTWGDGSYKNAGTVMQAYAYAVSDGRHDRFEHAAAAGQSVGSDQGRCDQ